MFIHSATVPGSEHGGPHISHTQPSTHYSSASSSDHGQSLHLFKRRKLEHVPDATPAANIYSYPSSASALVARAKQSLDSFLQPTVTRDKGMLVVINAVGFMCVSLQGIWEVRRELA